GLLRYVVAVDVDDRSLGHGPVDMVALQGKQLSPGQAEAHHQPDRDGRPRLVGSRCFHQPLLLVAEEGAGCAWRDSMRVEPFRRVELEDLRVLDEVME